MDEKLILEREGASVGIAPESGGAISSYTVSHGGNETPIFATTPDSGRTGVFALGCNVLAPWSNRISGGGFTFDGRFHPLAPNLPGDRYPNHGNAFMLPWRVAEASSRAATLALTSDGPGPYRYEARLTYALEGRSLRATLELRNLASLTLPYGGGFHPWFVRTPRTRLGFAATGVWLENADHLPDRYLATSTHPDWDFARTRPLPDSWLNNAWTSWTGSARIEWPETGLAAELSAGAPLETLIVYSPSAEANYISIEPVSHSVDAHNQTAPGTAPLTLLAPGATMTMTMSITPTPL